MRALVLLVVLAGCADQPEDPRAPVAGDVLSVDWTSYGYSASTQPELDISTTRVDCGTEVSHPCPFLAFTKELDIGDGTMTWGHATGGADANGVPVENHLPATEALDVEDLTIVLAARGDDAGLRLASKLKAVPGGFSGVVDYELFNVAGYTRFHVSLTWN